MTTNHRFVAVTFGEFSAWHASGETRVLRARVSDLPETDDDEQRHAIRMLVRRLPPLSLDDEEGCLIIRLGDEPLRDDVHDSQLVRIPMTMLRGVIPLTTRARSILEGRLKAFWMELEPPRFENAFRVHSYNLRAETASRAGVELAKIFAPEASEGLIDARLKKSAAVGLDLLDFEGKAHEASGTHAAPDTWVSAAFQWARPRPYHHGALNHLFDAGGLLKNLQENGASMVTVDVVNQLREIATAMQSKSSDQMNLAGMLSSDGFAKATNMLQEKASGAMPAGLPVLVLFLRWREDFQQAGTNIDIGRLTTDLETIRSLVGYADLISALWLLGFYVGAENVMPLAYAAANKARFAWFAGKELRNLPTIFSDQPQSTSFTPDNVEIAGSDSTDAGMPESREETNPDPNSSQPDQVPENHEQPVSDYSIDEAPSATDATASSANETVPHDAPENSGQLNQSVKPHSEAESADDALSKYGALPWKSSKDDDEAKRVALQQARNRSPDLNDETLYKVVAKEWFGHRATKPFLLKLENIDKEQDKNPTRKLI